MDCWMVALYTVLRLSISHIGPEHRKLTHSVNRSLIFLEFYCIVGRVVVRYFDILIRHFHRLHGPIVYSLYSTTIIVNNVF